MELQQLKYFQTVAQIEKIADAAAELFISAPALSTSIARLEKELGIKLFDRTGNRITLNPQGQILLKYTNRIFAELDNAKEELQQSLLPQEQHLSFISTNTLIWVNLIAAFTAEFSHYTLSSSKISISQLAENGMPAQHNFLLAYESEISPEYANQLDSIGLFRVTPMVMIHKDHHLSQKQELDIREIANERFFLPMPDASLYARLQQLFELHQLPFPKDNFCAHLYRQKMVSENQGISFLSMHPGHAPLPDVRYIPLADPFAPWNARLFWHKDRVLSPHELEFKAFAEAFYQDQH